MTPAASSKHAAPMAAAGAASAAPSSPSASRGATRALSAALWRALATFLRFLGPGLLMAVAFLDPGNMAADVNMGVFAGYTLLWVTLYGTAAAWVVQSLSARLGLQTGADMAAAVKTHYPAPVAIFLLVAVELAVLATDMLESIGGAVAVSGLSGGRVPMWVGVLITCAVAFALLQLQQYGRRPLEALMGALIAALAVAVFALFFSVGPDWPAVFRGLAVPTVTADTAPLAVGALGALVMPHNVYLYSQLMAGHRSAVEATGRRRAARIVSAEAALALALTFAINVAAVCVFARGFEAARTEGGLGLAGAGEALSALKKQQTGSESAGAAYSIVWFVGLLASALASTLTTSFAGQHILAVMFGLKGERAWHRYVPRLVTLLPAMAVAGFAGQGGGGDKGGGGGGGGAGGEAGFAAITNWLNVVTALMIPFAVLPLVALCANEGCMIGDDGAGGGEGAGGAGADDKAKEQRQRPPSSSSADAPAAGSDGALRRRGGGCFGRRQPRPAPEERRRALEARGARPDRWMLWVGGATAIAILGMNTYNLVGIPPPLADAAALAAAGAAETHNEAAARVNGAGAAAWPPAVRAAWFLGVAVYTGLCLLFVLPLRTWRRIGDRCAARWAAAGLPTHWCPLRAPAAAAGAGARPSRRLRLGGGGKASPAEAGGGSEPAAAAASAAAGAAAAADAAGAHAAGGRPSAAAAPSSSSSGGSAGEEEDSGGGGGVSAACRRAGSGAAPEPAPFLLDGPLTYVLASPPPAEVAAAESGTPSECELGLLPEEDGRRGGGAGARGGGGSG